MLPPALLARFPDARLPAGGEGRATWLVTDAAGAELVLKTGVSDLDRLVAMVDRLRAAGCPAPRIVETGSIDGLGFTLQERLPGRPMNEPGRVADLVELIDLQSGLGDPTGRAWPGWLLGTLVSGGDGYCLHSTMRQRADTSRMLEEIVAIGVGAPTSAPSADVVHFDFSFANVLTDGERITGVIDWNVPWPGDRAFDVATLLFYAYERPDLRSWLWEQLLGRTSPEWAVVYLAHMVLRQVEWSVRHYPGSTVEQHYLAVGRAVLNDLSIL